MAGRTGIGIGMGAFITILSITWVGLFVTTVAFMAQRSAALRKYKDLQEKNDQYITEAEKASDDVKQIALAASKKNQSLVKFLIESERDTMRLATGNDKTTLEGLQKTLEGMPGGKNSNLLQNLRDRELELSTAKKSAEDATKAREQALTDKTNEVNRVKALEDNYKKSLDASSDKVNQYKSDVDNLGKDNETFRKEQEVRIEKIRSDAQTAVAERDGRIADLEKQVLLANGTISRLQNELKGRTPTVTDEYALVDARVLGVDASDNTVFLSIGRKQKVRIGMTFEVYNDANSIRPDAASGEYPQGKASLEVINVDNETCTARVTREKRGNPIVKGDVVANAVYDPNKVYTMLVYGNFDANRDGISTQQEQSEIRSMIEEWNGKVVDDLTGSVDFIVLGQKPNIPPPPPQGSPVAVIQEYIRVKKIADRYEELVRQAQAMSLPVLNENRFYTLIGKKLAN